MRRHLKKRPYIFPILGLLAGFAVVALIWANSSSGATFRPSDARVVYLFDKGEQQVLNTKAQTVAELVGRLGLGLIKEDVVEPSLDTPIVEDNFRINIYRARPVTVVDDSSRTVTLTAARSPRAAAQSAGLEVKAEDLATFVQGSLNENIIGEKVVVSRATPIKLNLYGTQVNTYTQAKTVGALLDEKRIELNNGESVNPALGTEIKPKMQVFVLSKGTKLVTVEEEIPIPTKTVSDASLSFGTTAIRQAGSPGKKLVTYLVINKKDEPSSRKIIQQAIIEPPVPKIVARGSTIKINGDKSGLMAAAGVRSSDYQYVNFIISRESGWCPTKWQGEYGGCPAYHGAPTSPYVGYGLCQSTPGNKMSTAGADWATNPITQLRWCHNYAQARHGGWGGAYNFWLNNHYW